MAHIANNIVAKDRKLSEILSGQRYKIDFFQREYRWQRTHIEALVSDLATSFLRSYTDGDDIEKYESYDCYYMGPLVLCEDKGAMSIVDGQQRLTSFTLLLIYLHHLQSKLNIPESHTKDILSFIFIKKGGKKSLVINVDKREETVISLIENPDHTLSTSETLDESCQNLLSRYEDITKLFPQELSNSHILPIFIEWLLDRIVLVEVRAFSMDNAYSIFETMNDRGLSLNPTEILKGYLLSKMSDGGDEEKMEDANNFWKLRIQDIKSVTNNDGDLDFFRAWLRGKYADTQRSKTTSSENQDFEIIGTQFHAWVKNNTHKLHLKAANDYYFFMRSDFDFYSSLYLKLIEFTREPNVNMLYINSFYPLADSLTYPLYLSSLSKMDTEDDITEKIDIVSKFIDSYTNIRVIQNKSITQSSIRWAIYEIVKSIRNLDVSSLSSLLSDELERNSNEDVLKKLQPMDNWGYYHYFYARIIYHLNSEGIDDFSYLMRSRRRQSLVLHQLFNESDFEPELELPILNLYRYSVAGFGLIRRDDIDNYNSMPDTRSKLLFLQKHNYLPEVTFDGIDNTIQFIEQRDQELSKLAAQIWNAKLR